MDAKTSLLNGDGGASELFTKHHTRVEVSPYFVALDVRPFGAPPIQQKIQAGFDLDLYANGLKHGSLSFENGELQETVNELCAACGQAIAHAKENCQIEIIPFNTTLVFDTQSHLQPEALVRIRLSHPGGLDQPAGANEEKALADLLERLHSLGVRRY